MIGGESERDDALCADVLRVKLYYTVYCPVCAEAYTSRSASR